MGQYVDLTGRRFGKLEVVSYSYSTKYGIMWNCRCDCGRYVEALSRYLTRGSVQSCGCLRNKEQPNQNEDCIDVWQAQDEDGRYFLYPMKPIKRWGKFWICPYIDKNLNNTIGLDKPLNQRKCKSKPVHLIIPKSQFLQLKAQYIN